MDCNSLVELIHISPIIIIVTAAGIIGVIWALKGFPFTDYPS